MRIFLKLVAVFFFVGLTACTGKPVKTYDGDKLPDDQVALLNAVENIQVLQIDGKKMTKYLLSNIETNYALSPGKHRVVFIYTSVWAKTLSSADESRSELVESKPQVVEFEAAAGDRLRFDFDHVDNVRDARVLAERFAANVVDANAEVVAASTVYNEEKEQELAAAKESVKQALAEPASYDQSLPALDAMKLLWEKSSAEDKKEFLKWAFQ